MGFDRAGFRCVGQVENDPYCQKVLRKHWPDVPKHGDIKTFTGEGFEHPEVIIGGFPCQGISSANYRAKGLADERSGLWSEYFRLIRHFRPRYVVAENVAALTFRGLDTVLGDLASIGFDAEWQTLPAAALGAPHRRNRIFIVAYPSGERCEADEVFNRSAFEATGPKQASRLREWPGQRERSPSLPNRIRWVPDGELCRVADGLPDELDRYKQLGNAVVPQVAYWIARRIKDSHA